MSRAGTLPGREAQPLADEARARVLVAGASGYAGALCANGIKEVRGRGLMVGVGLAEGLDAHGVASRCLDAGLVINVPGPGMLRFLPPLVIEAADAGKANEIVRDALA